MSSVVLELQREVYEQTTTVSNLLLKAYTLSRKLKVKEFGKWASLELNGYAAEEVIIPEYRKIYGEVYSFNPNHGNVPLIHYEEIEEIVTQKKLYFPIKEIEDLIKIAKDNRKSVINLSYPAKLQSQLMDATNSDYKFSLHVSITQFQKIVDRVRFIILDWTLKLEESGVMGEGMTFNSEEKDRAVKSGDIIINNIGNMINSQLQQKAIESTQSQVFQSKDIQIELGTVIDDAKKLIEEIKDQFIKDELVSEIETLESQAKSPKPKLVIIAETLKSIRNIAEGVTGSLIAADIQSKIALFLSTLG